MIVGHIGARKGSKGVPGKNFRTLNGKPLIDWSLDQLLGNPRIDVVIVSTDDEDIYRHARSKQTLDIGMRPPELCTDVASKRTVWQHSLRHWGIHAQRACAFCNVKTGKPEALDQFEPYRVSQTVKNLGLDHVVITSVDRDDLGDAVLSQFGSIMMLHDSKRQWSTSMPHPPMCWIQPI